MGFSNFYLSADDKDVFSADSIVDEQSSYFLESNYATQKSFLDICIDMGLSDSKIAYISI